MLKQKILIIGSGGREHAVGWKVAQSPRAGEIYFAPGNAGTSNIGTNVAIGATEIQKLVDFVKSEKINLTLALPDDPLALGIVDAFRAENLRIFGPTKSAAQLESSKAFSKNFMKAHGLPTAKFKIFTDYNEAIRYVDMQSLPIVIKASGLALGKGVIIAENRKETHLALEDILVKKVFGDAGNEVVIEEFLIGPEISTHAFSDGNNFSFFPTAQDHKKIGENDVGLNTGGMGTIAPLPKDINGKDFASEELLEDIKNKIIAPTLEGMKEDENIFEGILYPGLMLTTAGPKILEYNARFGDPETQTYMRLLETDLLDIVDAIIDHKLSEIKVEWKKISACTIVLASGGYPEKYEKGKTISGVEEAEQMPDVVVFHAGTKIENIEDPKQGRRKNLVTNGGRVLGVSATGENLEEALAKAYEAVKRISFEGMYYRKDIGKKTLGL